MTEQEKATFGSLLRVTLEQRGHSQAWLAKALDINPAQVSRWVNDKVLPHIETAGKISELLDVDFLDAYRHAVHASDLSAGGDGQSAEEYDLFVSTPISGLNRDDIEAHRAGVSKVVDAATIVGRVYWSGVEVQSAYDLGAADLQTEINFKCFNKCRAYLYLQFAEIVYPSGALVELGFALGRRLKTTMIIKRDLRTPYMLEGFQGVAARQGFLPEVHIYVVDDFEDAVRLIQHNGGQLLL